MVPQAPPVYTRSTAAEAKEHVLGLLQNCGYRVAEQGPVRVPVAGLRFGASCDVVMSRDSRQFAVVCKAARRFAEWLFQWLARPILELQALRRLRGCEPLLAVVVEPLDPRAVRRFRAQLAFYAPDVWWILADRAGNYALHLPDDDRDHLSVPRPLAIQVRDRVRMHDSVAVEVLPPAPPPALAFSDLDQLLLKTWLLRRTLGPGLEESSGAAPTLMALARRAAVAPPLVYRWAAAMQRRGYLRKWRRVPLLQNGDGLLAEWRGRYRLTDNPALLCDPVFGVGPDFLAEFLQRLRDAELPPYALTGHLACRAMGLTHSEARSVQLFVAHDPLATLQPLQLVPSENPAAPVQLLTPRHPRSVWAGVAAVEGMAVCDAFQVYLDLYHLADRGRAQADLLYERLLAPMLQAATEPRDAL